MTEKDIQLTVKEHIAYVQINRPEAGALKEICGEINGNPDIYTAVFVGAFTGGGDMEEAVSAVASLECPVIAAVAGNVTGAGLETALAADVRIASDNAVFAMPQVKEGRLPAGGGTQRLPRIVGRGKALEMLLTAESLNAAQALEIGLVSKVVPAGDMAAEAQKLAETVAAKGPLALRYLKEAILKGMDMTLEQGLRLEADLYFLLHTTADRTEGIKAFQEKRQAKWENK